MSVASEERALWLARHILPAEPALRAWLGSRVPSGLEADDIVQEAYAVLAALAAVDHIRDPRTYLFQVAKTVILQHVRRNRIVTMEALAHAAALEVPDIAPSAETRLADRQELGRVAAHIAQLPAKCREAFTLRKVRGLSQREVARHMGISENTVEKHVAKGITTLMNAIGRGGTARRAASREREIQTVTAPARARSRD